MDRDTLTVQEVTLNGAPAICRVQGSGPDVLLLHGWISSGRMWEGVMTALESRFRCWAPDLPGFGDAPLPAAHQDSEMTLADYRAHVVALCDALDIQPYAVIGHSMGALLALSLALEAPALVPRLGLLAPPVTGRLHFNLNTLLDTDFGAELVARAQHIWPLPAWMLGPSVFAPAPHHLSTKARAVIRKAEDARKAAWAATTGGLRAVLKTNYGDRLRDVQQPTLVVVGAFDLTIPPSEGELAAERIPQARLVRLPFVAHQLTDEAPEDVNQLLLEFLIGDAEEAHP
jgi:pimeloyl-ACP methyl ester carboxylesterase